MDPPPSLTAPHPRRKRKAFITALAILALVFFLTCTNVFHDYSLRGRSSLTKKSISSKTTSSVLERDEDEDIAYGQWVNFSPPSFAYLFSASGLGSQLMNFYAQVVYMAEHRNRSMIAMETTYGYRFNESLGVLTGFFTPHFPVVDTSLQVEQTIQRHVTGVNVTNWIARAKMFRPEWRGNAQNPPVILTALMDYRDRILQAYDPASLAFYHKMAYYMCPNMQFNARAQKHMAQLRTEHGIPDDFQLKTSVAFHVRRRDKVKEAPLHAGEAYVRKLQTAVLSPSSSGTAAAAAASTVALDYCFVATDDFKAVQEIRLALQEHNISCQLFSIATANTRNPLPRNQKPETMLTATTAALEFMTELDMMISATYFVGSFSSNIGAVVSVLRSCKDSRGGEGNDPDNASHYGQSFGVDQENWFFY